MAEFDADTATAAAETALALAIRGEEHASSDGAPLAAAIGTIVQMGPCAVQVALAGWCGLTLHGFARARGALRAHIPARPAPAGRPGRLTVTVRQGADGFWALEARDDRTGTPASIDQAASLGLRDAMRIVTCLGNSDHDTIAAIAGTARAAGPAALTDLMSETVRLAAKTARHISAGPGEQA